MYYYARFPTNTEIVKDLIKALNGEYHAIHCYELLANQAPNDEIKNRILEIRKDEMRHYRMFSSIFTSLTEEQPAPELTEKCPENFEKGVLSAFMDEQKTVEFYHQVARKSNNPVVRVAFMQAAEDEQNHAVWFLYFMNRR